MLKLQPFQTEDATCLNPTMKQCGFSVVKIENPKEVKESSFLLYKRIK